MRDAACWVRFYASALRVHAENGRELALGLAGAVAELNGTPLTQTPLNGQRLDHRRRRGRYPGDEELITRGADMVLGGEVYTANEAAVILASLHPGHSLDATRHRLGRAIRKKLKNAQTNIQLISNISGE